MTAELKAALSVSVGLHAGLLLGLPRATPVAFDVERAPTSLEVVIVAPTPTSSPAVLNAEAPAPQTVTVPEQRGALTEVLPRALRNPPPVYPQRARELGQEGTVVLEVEVLPTGRCGRLRVLSSSGASLLDDAAYRAVARWQFKPARRAGRPVASWVEIPVTFRLIE